MLQVKSLGAEANRLIEIHPDQAEDIRKKQSEIEHGWEKLKHKVRYPECHRSFDLFGCSFGRHMISVACLH